MKKYQKNGIEVEISANEMKGKVKEYHIIFHVTDVSKDFQAQLNSIHRELSNIIRKSNSRRVLPVFARCFLTDASNQQLQASVLLSSVLNCPISYVKQPLLDGSKLALWIYFQSDVNAGNDGLYYVEHNGYRHYYTSGNCSDESILCQSAYEQTHYVFETYEKQLLDRDCTIEKNCVRTWLFVRDVDVNYQDVVKARKENFLKHGLKNNTHYIASTGIEGCNDTPKSKILLDAVAIKGLDEGQVNYLYAKRYLSPTYDYGVTFERGVMIDFGDRRNVYISGTASINNKGLIVHPGNLEKQIVRMWTNVKALLKEAGCTFGDLMQLIVYLRDIADYQMVKKMFDEKFKDVPKLIVLAPICRPGWLIEMECIASKPITNPKFRDL